MTAQLLGLATADQLVHAVLDERQRGAGARIGIARRPRSAARSRSSSTIVAADRVRANLDRPRGSISQCSIRT